MMPVLNAHSLGPTWAEPEAELVQEFFDILLVRYVRDEPQLIRDTTEEELAYIAARAGDAALAEGADSLGTVKDEVDVAVEERKFAEWTGAVGGSSGARAGVPLIEDVVEETAKEETKADDPPAPKRKCVLRRASSGEPVRPGRTMHHR